MITNYVVAISPDGVPEIFGFSCDVIDDINIVMEYEENQLILELQGEGYEIIENVGMSYDEALSLVEKYS